MGKIDKSQYTKEEWKHIKELRRKEKEAKSLVVDEPSIKHISGSKRYVVCLKHGNKYGSEYVNTLYNMVKRNCTLDFEFVCFTENAEGIDETIRVIDLPQVASLKGWWYKPYFFSANFPLKGTILYIDLDVIIFRNIDKLFEYKTREFCILKDFNRSLRPDWKKFNSSVFRLETGSKRLVYDNFIKDPATPIKRLHGDQDWIFEQIRSNFNYWPDEWIQSYKWEMRGRPTMTRDNRGRRNFSAPGTPKILDETCIAVFHGEPNPHDCIDPWCRENWQ